MITAKSYFSGAGGNGSWVPDERGYRFVLDYLNEVINKSK